MSRPGARFVATVAVIVTPLLAYWAWRAGAPREPAALEAANAPYVPTPQPTDVPSGVQHTADAEQRTPDYTGTLVVRVVRASDGAAMPGTSVRVVDGGDTERRAATLADGSAGFDRLGLGHARIRVEADGCVPSLVTVVVGPDAVERATIPLDAAVSVEGTVLDLKTGEPIAYAAIELRADRDPDRDHPPIAPTTTDAAGKFRVVSVPAGATVSITSTAPGHGHATAGPTRLRPDDDVSHFEMLMGRTGAVHGIVRGPDGIPVEGARVRVAPTDDPQHAVAETGPDGSYRIAEIRPGTEIVITARAAAWTDCDPVRGTFVTDDRPDASRDLTLRPPTSLVVRVTGPSGDVRRAMASVGGRAWTEPGLTGAITFDHVTPGSVDVRAKADGCAPATRTVTVRPAVRNEIEIRLKAPVAMGVLHVVVVDAAGAAVGGARVSVRDGADVDTASTANESGTLDVHVFPRRCRVRAGGEWSEVTVPEGGEATVRVVAK